MLISWVWGSQLEYEILAQLYSTERKSESQMQAKYVISFSELFIFVSEIMFMQTNENLLAISTFFGGLLLTLQR